VNPKEDSVVLITDEPLGQKKNLIDLNTSLLKNLEDYRNIMENLDNLERTNQNNCLSNESKDLLQIQSDFNMNNRYENNQK
jgi:hypothetical protein